MRCRWAYISIRRSYMIRCPTIPMVYVSRYSSRNEPVRMTSSAAAISSRPASSPVRMWRSMASLIRYGSASCSSAWPTMAEKATAAVRRCGTR